MVQHCSQQRGYLFGHLIAYRPENGHHFFRAALGIRRVHETEVDPFAPPQPERAVLSRVVAHCNHQVKTGILKIADRF